MGLYIKILESQNLGFGETEKANAGRKYSRKVELDEKIWRAIADCKEYASYQEMISLLKFFTSFYKFLASFT